MPLRQGWGDHPLIAVWEKAQASSSGLLPDAVPCRTQLQHWQPQAPRSQTGTQRMVTLIGGVIHPITIFMEHKNLVYQDNQEIKLTPDTQCSILREVRIHHLISN